MHVSFSQCLANPLISTLIGGAITWICAWFYYKRAGDELRKEAALLQKATSTIIYFLEHPEAEVKVQRDAAGRAVGVIVSAEAHARGTSTAKGVITVADPEREVRSDKSI
jgi:hypothetical protein